MNRIRRMGTILVVLGLSLLLIAIVRGGSPEVGQSSQVLSPTQQSTKQMFIFPRDLKLDIETQSPITIKLQAPSGRLIVNLQNITDSSSYVCHLEERGTYFFSVSNPTNTTAHVRIITTFYGFESDLVDSSLVLIFAGIVSIVASGATMIIRRRLRRNRKGLDRHP